MKIKERQTKNKTINIKQDKMNSQKVFKDIRLKISNAKTA
jgi:hypothetical protein